MSRPAAIGAPPELAELVGREELTELVRTFANLSGLGTVVADCAGRLVVSAGPGADAGLASALPLSPEADLTLDERGGLYYRAPLLHDEGPVGVLLLGPYVAAGAAASAPWPRRDGRQIEAASEHLATILGLLLRHAQARYLTGEMHVAALTEANAQLASKDQQLGWAAERIHEVDRMKSSFLATVSHELRTPLTSVIGYSEMLLEGLAGDLNPAQRDYLDTVVSKARHLLELISAILDLSLLESGSLEFDAKPVEMRGLIGAIIAAFLPEARKREIAIESRLAPVPRAWGDDRKIRQALAQVVANAVKFTRNGGSVIVSLDVGPLHPDDRASGFANPVSRQHPADYYGLRVMVHDSGIGIPVEKQRHIFEPFFQVDSSSTREYGGTGLGLTLAKRFVEAHGGFIWLSSRLGEGSLFTLSLPAVRHELDAYLPSHSALHE